MMKRKRDENNELLLCCHATWTEENGFTTLPENTFLYIYAPLGSALSQAIPRAIASGHKIKLGELTISRISPITLFNYGYEDRGERKGDYETRDSEMTIYPMLYKPGDKIPNYSVVSPGKDYLTTNKDTNITVVNLKNIDRIFISEVLEKCKGNVCHFGGCSWIRADNDKRDIVTFSNKQLESQFTPKLSDAEKMEMRKKRFRQNPGN